MSQRKPLLLSRSLRVALVGVWLFIPGSIWAQGQGLPASTSTPASQSPTSDKDDRSGDFGSNEAEMRARLILKAEKKEYDENVARAREVSDLAAQLLETYESTKTFKSEDNKKLERLEKLTKRIRNEAGGSNSDVDVKDIPGAMGSAVKRVVELADQLRKLVEKTPRHVVSAAVIDQANKLIGLVQHVRTFSR